MDTTSTRQRNVLIMQIIGLTVFCLGLIAIAYWTGVFKKDTTPRAVVLRVESSAGSVNIIYSYPGESITKSITVQTPWTKTLRLPNGSQVFLSVTNPAQIGQIRCTIRVNNTVWKDETAKAPGNDKVSCAGIVP